MQNEAISEGERERVKKEKDELESEKVDEKLAKEKRKWQKKKRQGKLRLVLTPEEWAALPDPIPKSDLQKYAKDQKMMNLNASKAVTDSFNKTKAAITEIGNQTAIDPLRSPMESTGQQQGEKKVCLDCLGLGGGRRTRRRRKRRKRGGIPRAAYDDILKSQNHGQHHSLCKFQRGDSPRGFRT